MGSDLRAFAKATIRHWVVLVTGAVVGGGERVVGLFGDPQWVPAGIVGVGVIAATFLAWRDMRDEREAETARADTLQAERDRRLEPRIRLTTEVEVIDNRGTLNEGGMQFPWTQYFWLTVHSDGPTGNWEATFANVVGMSGGEYSPQLAWENTRKPLQQISRGGNQRIKLATLGQRQGGDLWFWFWMPESASWSPGGFAVNPQPVQSALVSFDLRLYDQTNDHASFARVQFVDLKGPATRVEIVKTWIVDDDWTSSDPMEDADE